MSAIEEAKGHFQRAIERLATVQYLDTVSDSATAPHLSKILMRGALEEIETGAVKLGIQIMVPARGDEL